MKMKQITVATFLAVSLAMGGGSALAGDSTKAAEVQKLIDDADRARKKAASVEGEWRDTGKFIKKAKAALKEGKYDAAAKLAKKAKEQGELGYKQAMDQQTLKMPSYVKY